MLGTLAFSWSQKQHAALEPITRQMPSPQTSPSLLDSETPPGPRPGPGKGSTFSSQWGDRREEGPGPVQGSRYLGNPQRGCMLACLLACLFVCLFDYQTSAWHLCITGFNISTKSSP